MSARGPAFILSEVACRTGDGSGARRLGETGHAEGSESMSFLKRLFGEHSVERRPAEELGDQRGDLPDNALALYSGPPRSVVGESHYRGAIERVTGGARRDGVKVVTWAALLPEPDNPHDGNAVAVHIDGLKVGHLPRNEAAAFKPVLDRLAASGRVGYCRADVYGGWNRGQGDAGDYSITLYVGGPDRQAELLAVEIEGKSRAEVAAARPPIQPGRGKGPGFFRGRHSSEWFPEVRRLRASGDQAGAEELLLGLVEATEDEARQTGSGVAPAAYEQLAVIYRQRGDAAGEVAILERFAAQPHAPGALPPQLLDRLERARLRSQRS